MPNPDDENLDFTEDENQDSAEGDLDAEEDAVEDAFDFDAEAAPDSAEDAEEEGEYAEEEEEEEEGAYAEEEEEGEEEEGEYAEEEEGEYAEEEAEGEEEEGDYEEEGEYAEEEESEEPEEAGIYDEEEEEVDQEALAEKRKKLLLILELVSLLFVCGGIIAGTFYGIDELYRYEVLGLGSPDWFYWAMLNVYLLSLMFIAYTIWKCRETGTAYRVFLAFALAGILSAVFCLLMELKRYEYDVNAKSGSQSAQLRPAAQFEPPDSLVV